MAASGHGDNSLVLDIEVEYVLAPHPEQNGNVKIPRRHPGHQPVDSVILVAVGVAEHEFTLVGDVIFADVDLIARFILGGEG